MLHRKTAGLWLAHFLTLQGGRALILTCCLLVCGATAQSIQQPQIAGRSEQQNTLTRPKVVRNPNVKTPFERVLGPHMQEYSRLASKPPAMSAARPQDTPESGVGGTNVNFPGFVAAPYLTLTGGVQTSGTVGYQSYASVAGDFNGDGYPDVAVAQSDGTINVVLSPGPQSNLSQGIQIAPNTSANLPGGAVYLFWLEAADLNGDGKLDLIGEDFHNSYLVVWLGNGDGTFQKSTAYTVAPKSGAPLSFVGSGGGIIVGDFNNDGAPDVATVETSFSFQNSVFGTMVTEQTFLNDGKGNLRAGLESDSFFGDSYEAADAGELSLVSDGSKTTGIAFMIRNAGFSPTSKNGTSILIFGSNGDGSFAPAVEPTAPAVVESIFEPLPRTRLIATNLTTKPSPPGTQIATTDILFITGDGWVYDEPYTPQTGSFALSTPATVLIGGGTTTPGGTRYNPYVRSRNASSAANTAPSPTTPPIPFEEGINVADANGDGLPDLFVYSSGATYVYLNGGNGRFTAAPAQLANGHAAMEQPQPQDYNGSGFTSIPVLDSQQLELGYFQGSGTGLFYGAPAVAGTGVSNTLAISDNITVQAAGDFNGDGLQDVIAQDWTNSAASNGYPDIALGINNGNQSPANETNNFTFMTVLTGANFASLNGAFVEPVVFANPAGGTNVLLATKGGISVIAVNKGAASAPVPLLPPGILQCAPNLADAGDLNGDGIADIVFAYGGDSSCNANGLPSGFFTAIGKPDGTFGQTSFTAYGSSLYQARLIDFNGDGSPDLALNDMSSVQGSYGISILPNLANGSGGFDISNAVQPSTGYIVSDIVPGDFNSDGKQDLTLTAEGLFDPSAGQIVPNSWGVLLLPGKGDFTFGIATTVNPGYFSEWGSYADFNGDGAPDLALAEYGDTLTLTNQSGQRVQLPSLVQILPNLGGGNFGPSIGEFDGYFEDTVAYDNQPSYTLSAYTFTGNFGSGPDLLVAGSFNSAEFLNQGTDYLALTPSATSANQGDNVTLKAMLTQKIAVNPHAPTGIVSFYNNGNLIGATDIGSDSTASLTIDQLPLGTNALTAVYAGDAHYNAANAAAAVTVAIASPPPTPPAPPAPDFTLAANPGTLSVTQGATAIVTLTANGNSSFQGAIDFTCSSAPDETSCIVNPGSVTLNGAQAETVSVVVATTAKGSQTQAMLWKNTVASICLAGLLLWMAPRRSRLHDMLMLIAVAALSLGAVALAGCGSSGHTASTPLATPTPAPAGNPGTPTGPATLTITATSGNITHTQAFTIQVTAPQS